MQMMMPGAFTVLEQVQDQDGHEHAKACEHSSVQTLFLMRKDNWKEVEESAKKTDEDLLPAWSA